VKPKIGDIHNHQPKFGQLFIDAIQLIKI